MYPVHITGRFQSNSKIINKSDVIHAQNKTLAKKQNNSSEFKHLIKMTSKLNVTAKKI